MPLALALVGMRLLLLLALPTVMGLAMAVIMVLRWRVLGLRSPRTLPPLSLFPCLLPR